MANLAASKTYVTDLLNAGNDAFSNLYEVVLSFQNGFADEADGQTFSMRCTGFTPPESSGGDTYRVNYVTAFVDWPTAKVNVTRNFDLEFRVDHNYKAYKKLHELSKGNFNPNEEFVATSLEDLKDYSFTVTVNVLKNGSSAAEESDKFALYTFKHCLLLGVTPVDFTQGTANALTAKASFIYGEIEDLQTNM